MTDHLRYTAFFIALMATALAQGAPLAHAMAFLNKIDMPEAAYFTAQEIYAGWANVAWLLLVELAGILAVTLLYRHDRRVLRPALFALLAFAAAQAVFWIWTYPANVATDHWTTVPENWQTLRRQWEYSHLAGAVFQLLAMAGLVRAALRRASPHPRQA